MAATFFDVLEKDEEEKAKKEDMQSESVKQRVMGQAVGARRWIK